MDLSVFIGLIAKQCNQLQGDDLEYCYASPVSSGRRTIIMDLLQL